MDRCCAAWMICSGADRSTVLAVRYLSRSLRDLPLGFIGSSRLLPRGADVAALFATEGADLLTMGPLDAEASRQLLLSTISTAPPGEMEWWLARAGGNPLFILETASAVKAEGESVAEGALPTSLLASVRRHLGYVPADAMSVLRLAAVLGSSFSLEHLAAVARLPIHDVLAPIQAALEAGILVEKDSLLVFRHELIREALYDELPAEGRRLLHADTASVLLMLDAPGLVVAEHLLSSERPPDDDELVRLLSAADQVTNAKDRAELLERILALTAPSHRQRTEVVSRAITALTQAARGPEADDLVAAERAMDEGSIGGKVALSYLRSLSERSLFTRTLAEIVNLQRQKFDEDERSEVAGMEAIARLFSGDPAGGIRSAELAVELAGRAKSDGAVLGLQAQCLAAVATGAGRQALMLARQAVRSQPPDTRLESHILVAGALILEDRHHLVAQTATEGERRGDRLGSALRPSFLAMRALALFDAGLFDDADTAAETLLGVDRLAGPGGRLGPAHGGPRLVPRTGRAQVDPPDMAPQHRRPGPVSEVRLRPRGPLAAPLPPGCRPVAGRGETRASRPPFPELRSPPGGRMPLAARFRAQLIGSRQLVGAEPLELARPAGLARDAPATVRVQRRAVGCHRDGAVAGHDPTRVVDRPGPVVPPINRSGVNVACP